MIFSILIGIVFIAMGAGMSGSFAMPLTKTKNWSWANGWFIFCFFGYIVFPFVASCIFAPGFMEILSRQSSDTYIWILSLGALYGLANLSFGLSLKYLGFALGFSISLGLMMVFGTIVPPIIDGRLDKMMQGDGATVLFVGLVIAVIGVIISGYSGYIKEKNEGADRSEYNFSKGIAAALFVGFTGSAQSLAIEQCNHITKEVIASGVNPLFGSVPIFIIIYAGSMFSTIIWFLFASRKTDNVVSLFKGEKVINNYAFCAIAGTLWFVNYIFYGMGQSGLGEFAFIAWGISKAFNISCGNLWGIYQGEWKNATPQNRRIMYIGLATLITASFIIGMSVN